MRLRRSLISASRRHRSFQDWHLTARTGCITRYSGAAVLERIETVVVGGGQAGLAMSYHLKRLGREHVVIERGRVGQSWRSERWDSLMFQFPNSSIQL
jgi:NADPH-dependent 2,4-dienoyl-CoA reductase/sulfur reductase-like enzyme